MSCPQERTGKGKSWNMARQEMINLDTLSPSDTHGWYITTTTYCPPARGRTGGVGKDSSLVQCMARAQYLSSNRLLVSSFIRSLTAHRNKFSRTGCIHVTPVQSQSRFALCTNVCNTQKCQGILTVPRFDLCPPPKA